MCSKTSTHILRDTQGEEDEDYRHQEHDRSLVMSSSLQGVVDDQPRPPPSPPPPSQDPSDNISDHLIDDVSIQISAELFDFDDSDIFHDTLQSSEVTSRPKCSNYEDHKSTYDLNGSTTSSTTTTATTITAQNHNQNGGLSMLFDPQVEIDNDISASIDFSTIPLPYNLNYPTNNYPTLTNNNVLLSHYPTSSVDPTVALLPLIAGPPLGLGSVFEDDCLPAIPHFLRTAVSSSSSSCTYLDPTAQMGSFPSVNLNPGLCNDGSGMFGGSLLMASELQAKVELDFQGDNAGIFCPDQLASYNSGDLQAFSNENSQLVSGATTSAPISTEISSLDDSTYKVGKLSAEQRKEKIHKYMKKRNERNFSKKIKYACRKTLADSRPRVRGRFAKNDEFGEGHRHMNGLNEDDDFDEVTVKEEDDMVNSSDIFGHISGVNSFKCNYQIQSWI